MAERGLQLSQEKTKLTHIEQGFDLLGFNVRKYKGKCLTKPKKDSVKSIYASIRQCVMGNKTMQQKELIKLIRPKIKGWANFYRHSASKRTFALLDDKVFKLLWRWACRRHPNKNKVWIRAKYFKTRGNQHWVFMATDKSKQYILPRFDATRVVRHNKIMGQANPYDKEWDAYFEKRALKRTVKPRNISTLATAI